MSTSLRSTPGRARVRVPYLKKRPEETPGSPAPCAALRPHRSSSLKIRGRARWGTPQGAAEVGDRIREQLGVRVDPQVGSGTFCIDLGVRHTENESRYILGIECDGKAYHNAPAARAYDLWRQRILEECGWRIIRIWSTSWRQNPQRRDCLSGASHSRGYAVSFVIHAQGRCWREVCAELGLSKGTAQRAFYSLPKNPALPKDPAGGTPATP